MKDKLASLFYAVLIILAIACAASLIVSFIPIHYRTN